MQIYLSTLTELDYDKSLNSIEESFDDNPETSWQARAKVKHLRKSPCYNFELEVIAKNENNDVVGHVLLIEVEINSDDKKSSPDSCVKCYTMFLPFLLIKIDVFS
ncbi:hypothetical protein GZ130_10875 [Staphylococcus aureus]|uniref:Uncharacterized protein n=1 Tax=Staphylococcus aureus TaxID=1280 RepID=A0ABD6JK61_STAAU|nr:hypothetical protein [Staphylococcus aureus]